MMEKIEHDQERGSITEEQASPLAWAAHGMKGKTVPEYRLPVALVEAASKDAALNLQPAKVLHLVMAEAQFSGSRSVIVPSAASRMVINAGRARARDAALALQELVLFVGVVGFTDTPTYALEVIDHVDVRENEIEFVLSRQLIDALNATGPFARVDLRDVVACTKLPALALLPLVEYRRRHSRGAALTLEQHKLAAMMHIRGAGTTAVKPSRVQATVDRAKDFIASAHRGGPLSLEVVEAPTKRTDVHLTFTSPKTKEETPAEVEVIGVEPAATAPEVEPKLHMAEAATKSTAPAGTPPELREYGRVLEFAFVLQMPPGFDVTARDFLELHYDTSGRQPLKKHADDLHTSWMVYLMHKHGHDPSWGDFRARCLEGKQPRPDFNNVERDTEDAEEHYLYLCKIRDRHASPRARYFALRDMTEAERDELSQRPDQKDDFYLVAAIIEEDLRLIAERKAAREAQEAA